MIREANPRRDKPANLPAETLTNAQRHKLRENEEKITRGARAWLDMGTALTDIRDNRLYRETHNSLEAYCWEKFRLERSVTYRLMDAVRRYQVLRPIADRLNIQFSAESQLRPLCRCLAVELPDVLKLAAGQIEPDADGYRVPTAKILAEAVRQVKTRNSSTTEKPPKGRGRSAISRSADAAAVAVRTMKDWADSTLLAVARAMARELTARGLIKGFGTPSGTEREDDGEPAAGRPSIGAANMGTKLF